MKKSKKNFQIAFFFCVQRILQKKKFQSIFFVDVIFAFNVIFLDFLITLPIKR